MSWNNLKITLDADGIGTMSMTEELDGTTTGRVESIRVYKGLTPEQMKRKLAKKIAQKNKEAIEKKAFQDSFDISDMNDLIALEVQ